MKNRCKGKNFPRPLLVTSLRIDILAGLSNYAPLEPGFSHPNIYRTIMKKIYLAAIFTLSAFVFFSCDNEANSGGGGSNSTEEGSGNLTENNANSEEGKGDTGEINNSMGEDETGGNGTASGNGTANVNGVSGVAGTATQGEESPNAVSYEDDFKSIKAAILKKDATKLAKYAALEDWQTVDELISLFDETFREMLENTRYADLADTKLNGKTLKDLTLMAKYGEEGEDEMESALMVYMETRPEGLRIVQYLMAG